MTCTASGVFSSKKTGDLFLLITVTIIDFTRVSHPGVTPCRMSPASFYFSDLVCPLLFVIVNLPTKIFPWRVSPGADRLPPP